ncbi:iron-containing alcohol dehydrogenase family protein [Kurthia huakuii]|uniref:iron-containing alcohol dehydrogenase family protein n=1 Tax=Kurthia huakuii TaxID=1421019 RepID=UPI000495A05E|nr:iron-containing alcohol dehydrogenase family protein [Kurthia huakuii]MBM7700386.1 putative oxidoreductase [Kurthia huakuii]
MKTIHVHAAPSEYILEDGILKKLESLLEARGIARALIVTGTKSWAAIEAFWPAMADVQTELYTYGGECSFSEIERVTAMMGDYDAIIGVGGGKVIDLAKAVANEVHKQVIVVPTLASNCAPWTPLSVLYDDTGAFVRYDVYPVASSLLLVEPALLLQAPRELFVAGIGDTIAKWYEADVQLRTIEHKTVPMMISYEAARQCKDILLTQSEKALAAVDTGVVNEAFIQVVETMFMYAGMVGGYGDHFGRTAGAHSVHNGLTALEASHTQLHGVKVAYGICVQLMLEERDEEIEALRPFYDALRLPQSLRALNIEATDAELMAVAQKATIAEESIHLMPIGDVTAARVFEAMKKLETCKCPTVSFS